MRITQLNLYSKICVAGVRSRLALPPWPIQLGKIHEVKFLRLRQLAGQPCCRWGKESLQGESHCSDICLEKISNQIRIKSEQSTAVHWTEEVEISDKGSWVWEVKRQRRISEVHAGCLAGLWLRAGWNMCRAGPPEVDQRAAAMRLKAGGERRDSAEKNDIWGIRVPVPPGGEISLLSYSQSRII